MHTSGEPTRIIISGYPPLHGTTLLEKRRYAKEHHDDIRRRLMLEPRGHEGMYGAIIVQETELTKSGEADIGVLFCHNEGYSTMCGHATIALGRFLVDTHDLKVFPRRDALKTMNGVTELRIHAPCGVIHVSVPSDSDEVTFLGIPSFVSKRGLTIDIPQSERGFISKERVTVDIAYGGAFYVLVSMQELGAGGDIVEAAAAIERLVNLKATQEEIIKHPTERDLEFLYGVIVTDKTRGGPRGELGLCFFAGGQVDRSPTGSGVMAKVALAVKEGWLGVGLDEWWGYESVVSLETETLGFQGCAVEKREEGIVVMVKGRANYTGASAFVCEEQDPLKDGFVLKLPE
ncbi:proline racemase [Desarmillaria tabescens]|uniref:trans-L-3-hydroxyproline dehydratase n=1 Tax=Armillaria tabescens TaxID=1929756 RepID=A0AA39TP08_ARMTA|nr:proline racemase [Desarmillaria tabescens]KAK0465612.1 proline racemase [Desarmillaria tabescens]